MEKINSEPFSEKIILPKEEKAHYIHEIEYYCDRNRCSWEKAIHKLGFDEELANTDIYEPDFKDEQDLLNIPDYMKYSHLSDADLDAAEKLMDKTGISMNEALIRLNLISNDSLAPQFEISQNYDNKLEVTSPEAPSNNIIKRNTALLNAVRLALSASQRQGLVHKIDKQNIALEHALKLASSDSEREELIRKIEKEGGPVDASYQDKRRDRESRAADKFLDEATGIEILRKSGVDEETLAKMASDYHKNFRDKYIGKNNDSDRDEFRRNLARQAKVYNIQDVDIWNRR